MWLRWLRTAVALAVLASPMAAAAQTIRLVPVVRAGLDSPVFATHAGDGTRRLFVVERPGRIRVVAGGALLRRPFLDIVGRVLSGNERGLLGLAFHPGYAGNGRFYATSPSCPHEDGPLAEGWLEGDAVICPWHGYDFELATGACRVAPGLKISVYPVRVNGTAVEIDLP